MPIVTVANQEVGAGNTSASRQAGTITDLNTFVATNPTDQETRLVLGMDPDTFSGRGCIIPES